MPSSVTRIGRPPLLEREAVVNKTELANFGQPRPIRYLFGQPKGSALIGR
jgi:hypothetical protein